MGNPTTRRIKKNPMAVALTNDRSNATKGRVTSRSNLLVINQKTKSAKTPKI